VEVTRKVAELMWPLPHDEVGHIRVVVGYEALVVVEALSVGDEVGVLEQSAAALHAEQLNYLIFLGALLAITAILGLLLLMIVHDAGECKSMANKKLQRKKK
jgi:hypothetical protein